MVGQFLNVDLLLTHSNVSVSPLQNDQKFKITSAIIFDVDFHAPNDLNLKSNRNPFLSQ